MEEDEEKVSYDAESLFTNISIKETIDYIMDQVYVQKKLTSMCTKLIFTRLFTNKLMNVRWVANSLLLLVISIW